MHNGGKFSYLEKISTSFVGFQSLISPLYVCISGNGKTTFDLDFSLIELSIL